MGNGTAIVVVLVFLVITAGLIYYVQTQNIKSVQVQKLMLLGLNEESDISVVAEDEQALARQRALRKKAYIQQVGKQIGRETYIDDLDFELLSSERSDLLKLSAKLRQDGVYTGYPQMVPGDFDFRVLQPGILPEQELSAFNDPFINAYWPTG